MALATVIVLVLLGCGVGLAGSVLGIGGGIFLIPVLVIYLHIPMHQAIATSLIAIIATSSAVASMNVERGIANMRLGISLEVSTALGAVLGALTAALLDASVLQAIFSVMLAVTAFFMFRKACKYMTGKHPAEAAEEEITPDPEGLGSEFFDPARNKTQRYRVRNFPLAMIISLFAGGLSGLLGIGGGIVQVPLLNLACKVPIKAAAATSNFMLGVTAAASAIIYYRHGLFAPQLAAIIVLGVIAGSFAGMKLLARAKSEYLQIIFGIILVIVAVKMFASGLQ